MDGFLMEDLARHIGQTITIFTTSGGLSGGGFTGVLICVDPTAVRILCDEGAAPCCPVGSACTGVMTPRGMYNNFEGYGGYGYGGYGGYGYGGCGGGYGGYGYGGFSGGYDGCGGGFNPLGSVTVIPLHAIAAFSHHAI